VDGGRVTEIIDVDILTKLSLRVFLVKFGEWIGLFLLVDLIVVVEASVPNSFSASFNTDLDA